MTTLVAYWPWWSVFAGLVVYELVAVATHRRTLSQMVWRAQQRWPGLIWVVVTVVGLLLAHFFLGLWAPPWTRVALDTWAKWTATAAVVLVGVVIVLDIWGGEE